MRRPLSLLFLLLLISVALFACGGKAPVPPSKYTHEQEWIVGTIGTDIAEVLNYAARMGGGKTVSLSDLECDVKETSTDKEHFSYKLTLKGESGGQNTDIKISAFVWDPDNYAGWTKQLLSGLKLKGEHFSRNDEPEFVEGLADFTPEKLAKENSRLSEQLSKHPLDATLHEEAAFLLTLQGLREVATCFYDLRPTLNRIVAHLSLAKALGNDTAFGVAGEYALIGLKALGGTTASAVADIDSRLSSEKSRGLKTWLRALKMRASNDYRIAEHPDASLVERLAYTRALGNCLGGDAISDYLKVQKPSKESAIDWIRIARASSDSVESGHLYSEPGLEVELADFARDCKLYKREPKSADDAVQILSLAPTRCYCEQESVPLQVISWPDIASFHARFILDSIGRRYLFEKNQWGVKEQAEEFLKQAGESFGQIRSYPLLELCLHRNTSIETNQSTRERVNELLSSTPELVNAEVWNAVRYPEPSRELKSWFVPPLPTGSAFDFRARNYESSPVYNLEQLAEYHQLDPYQGNIVRAWIYKKYPDGKLPGAELAQKLGPLVDYDIAAMNLLCNAYYDSDFNKYVQELEKMAKLDPDYYYVLGNIYVASDEPEKARRSYETGVQLGRDRVRMSNNCGWLVNYYFDHGQKEKSLNLAREAAEVYSGEGLLTLAELYERMGKLKDAESYLMKAKERYGYTVELCKFYFKHKSEDPSYEKSCDELLPKIFPQGIKALDPASLKLIPTSGARVGSETLWTRKFKIKRGDIIVAVNGIAVQNANQHRFLRYFNGDKIELDIWSNKQYKHISVVVPEGQLGYDLTPYRAPKLE